MTRVIIQIDESEDSVLRKEAHEVTSKEFGTTELKSIVADMKEALEREEDGVAIAAPQIGVSKRIFCISEKAYPEDAKWKPTVFINPIITKLSKKRMEMHEGCLSVRWIYGKTMRSEQATISAKDENGVSFSFGGSDLIAHIFQHETDHLDGILFIDHGYDLEEYSEDEIRGKK